MAYADSIAALTHSIEQAPKSDPVLERWVNRAKELRQEVASRILSLSRYLEELPQESYVPYADALVSVLQDPEMTMQIQEMTDLKDTLQDFISRLEKKGNSEKAANIKKAMEKITNP